ncbi:Queuosine precursor transporter [uncultured Caudovirales phage]|uniref:Queuosine transporter n=1 Tax=uncultured Caudovirales phage TaxID=2100421 RepID=A0A6J5KJ78_9CAUD|nr:Queuosine precursor transporter [uncultured Caudovirales phage]
MILALITYAMAMILANLLVTTFGPSISPINAFFFIGLDLTLRDWLHVRLKTWQMGGLIVVTGALTYLLNPAAGMIAIASAVSFTAASVVDWSVFAKLTGTWIKRANVSNIAGAAVDSVVFPTLAFGVLMPQIVVMQFFAKVVGGVFWAYVIFKSSRIVGLVK